MSQNLFTFSLTLDSKRFPKLPEGFASPVDDTPQRFVEQAEHELSEFRECNVSIAALDCNCKVEISGVSRIFSGGYSVTVKNESAHREVVIVFDTPGLGEPNVAREYQAIKGGKLLVSFLGQSEAEWFLCHLLQGLMPNETVYP